VAEQIRCNDRVLARKRRNEVRKGAGAVADPVDEQKRRPAPRVHERTSVAVYCPELQLAIGARSLGRTRRELQDAHASCSVAEETPRRERIAWSRRRFNARKTPGHRRETSKA
jgi:hypothetical protein